MLLLIETSVTHTNRIISIISYESWNSQRMRRTLITKNFSTGTTVMLLYKKKKKETVSPPENSTHITYFPYCPTKLCSTLRATTNLRIIFPHRLPCNTRHENNKADITTLI